MTIGNEGFIDHREKADTEIQKRSRRAQILATHDSTDSIDWRTSKRATLPNLKPFSHVLAAIVADDREHFAPGPPPVVCSERVLHYAVLDDTVRYNSGHRLFFVGGKELGRFPVWRYVKKRGPLKSCFVTVRLTGDLLEFPCMIPSPLRRHGRNASIRGRRRNGSRRISRRKTPLTFSMRFGQMIDAASAAKDPMRILNCSSRRTRTLGFATSV